MISAKMAREKTQDKRLVNTNRVLEFIEREIEKAIDDGKYVITVEFHKGVNGNAIQKKLIDLGYKVEYNPINETMTIEW